jgi:hypothetical protein
MKLAILLCAIGVSACATRHVPDTTTWYADCYNKQRQETLLSRAEENLRDDDYESRRNIRRLYWKLQKDCK